MPKWKDWGDFPKKWGWYRDDIHPMDCFHIIFSDIGDYTDVLFQEDSDDLIVCLVRSFGFAQGAHICAYVRRELENATWDQIERCIRGFHPDFTVVVYIPLWNLQSNRSHRIRTSQNTSDAAQEVAIREQLAYMLNNIYEPPPYVSQTHSETGTVLRVIDSIDFSRFPLDHLEEDPWWIRCDDSFLDEVMKKYKAWVRRDHVPIQPLTEETWRNRIGKMQINDRVFGVVHKITSKNVFVRILKPGPYHSIIGTIPMSLPINFQADPPRFVLEDDTLENLRVVMIDQEKQRILLSMPEDYPSQFKKADLKSIKHATDSFISKNLRAKKDVEQDLAAKSDYSDEPLTPSLKHPYPTDLDC